MKFKLSNAEKFGWSGLKGYAYSSKKDFKEASAAYFEVQDRHGKVKSKLCDRIYYVIEGRGKFIIGGKETKVSKTDVVIVPKNTPYDYKGKMKLFLVHAPAFDRKYEVKLE
jgi:mannose-6-phosphate isomerase-like protein (cupin superfamily)